MRRVQAGGAVLFDPVADGHAHLACRACGAVVDVDAAVDTRAAARAARRAGRGSTPARSCCAGSALRARRARREHQVVEDLRRQPALEQPAVDLLEQRGSRGRRTGARATARRPGRPCSRASRLAQPNQFASSSSPRDARVLEAGVAGEAAQVGGREGVHVDEELQLVVASLAGRRRGPRASRRRAQRAAPQRREASARRAWARREAVAVARRLAGERERPARAQHAVELARRRARGRAGGAARRGRRRGRRTRPEGQRLGVGGHGLDLEAERAALALQRGEHARARCRCTPPRGGRPRASG